MFPSQGLLPRSSLCGGCMLSSDEVAGVSTSAVQVPSAKRNLVTCRGSVHSETETGHRSRPFLDARAVIAPSRQTLPALRSDWEKGLEIRKAFCRLLGVVCHRQRP